MTTNSTGTSPSPLANNVIAGGIPLRQRARVEAIEKEEISTTAGGLVVNSVEEVRGKDDDGDTTLATSVTTTTRRKRRKTLKSDMKMELSPVFDALDKRLLLLLCVLGLCTRYYSLSWPKSVMFDEAHFVKFVSCYFTHEYFFDIHPPLAKLLMALVGNLGIWMGNQPIERYGGDYRDDFYFYLRLVPAFFGSLLVPMIYACGRASRLSKFPSFIAAWFVLLDNLILLEARTAVTDSVLLFWISSSYFSGAMITRKRVFSREWFIWTMITGVSLGCAISVKLTALAIIGTVGLLQMTELIRLYLWPLFFPSKKRLPRFRANTQLPVTEIVTVREGVEVLQRPPQPPSSPVYSAVRVLLADTIVRGVILLGLLVLIHFICWHIHFKLLVYNGEGNPFMEPQFISNFLVPPPSNLTHHCFHEKEKQLETFPPGAYPHLSTFGAMVNIHRTIHVVNFGLRASHPTASKWYTWPLMHCRVVPFYYGFHEGKPVKILSIGNLFTWYLMLGCIVIGGLLVVLFLTVEIAGFVSQHILGRVSERATFHRSGFLHRLQETRGYGFFSEIKKSFAESGLAIGLSLGGYVLNLIPFMLVPRITWIYHYQPAILHGMLFVGTLAHITLNLSMDHPRLHKLIQRLWGLTLLGATAMFYHYLPWTYGFPLTNQEHERLKLIKEWY